MPQQERGRVRIVDADADVGQGAGVFFLPGAGRQLGRRYRPPGTDRAGPCARCEADTCPCRPDAGASSSGARLSAVGMGAKCLRGRLPDHGVAHPSVRSRPGLAVLTLSVAISRENAHDMNPHRSLLLSSRPASQSASPFKLAQPGQHPQAMHLLERADPSRTARSTSSVQPARAGQAGWSPRCARPG